MAYLKIVPQRSLGRPMMLDPQPLYAGFGRPMMLDPQPLYAGFGQHYVRGALPWSHRGARRVMAVPAVPLYQGLAGYTQLWGL